MRDYAWTVPVGLIIFFVFALGIFVKHGFYYGCSVKAMELHYTAEQIEKICS